MNNLPKTLIFTLITLYASVLYASDFAKEKRWADQVVDSVMIGEIHWLKADGHSFLSIYTDNKADKELGGAIVLHGIGVHPNWIDVVYPLRTRLPEYGWHTLSLQLPILSNDAQYSEYASLFSEIAPRIDAGVAYLKQKGVKNIVLVAHSMGATMAGYYVANNDRREVKALVVIGAAGLLLKDPERDFVQSIKKIKKPILDLWGSEDSPGVLNTKKLKADTAKTAGHNSYQQVEVQGANHFMVGKEEEMLNEISRWMGKFGTN